MGCEESGGSRKRQRTVFESMKNQSSKKIQVSGQDSLYDDSENSYTATSNLDPEENAANINDKEYAGEASLASADTELETALPSVKSDQAAIDEYETSQAAERGEPEQPALHQRHGERKWIKGRSSIYVDAFNLALESVLSDEAHLFDEAEKAFFDHWRDLCYESQYLYVPRHVVSFLLRTVAETMEITEWSKSVN